MFCVSMQQAFETCQEDYLFSWLYGKKPQHLDRMNYKLLKNTTFCLGFVLYI